MHAAVTNRSSPDPNGNRERDATARRRRGSGTAVATGTPLRPPCMALREDHRTPSATTTVAFAPPNPHPSATTPARHSATTTVHPRDRSGTAAATRTGTPSSTSRRCPPARRPRIHGWGTPFTVPDAGFRAARLRNTGAPARAAVRRAPWLLGIAIAGAALAFVAAQRRPFARRRL